MSRTNLFKRFVILTAAVCLFLLLPACSSEENGADESAGNTDSSVILTDIFAETLSELPENARIDPDILPYYDSETETVTMFVVEFEEIIGADGVIDNQYTTWLYTLTPDGELTSREELPLFDESMAFDSGAVLRDTVIYACETQQEGLILYRIDRATGDMICTEKSHTFFGKQNFSLFNLCVDAEERIYCTDKNTVFVLNPDFTLAFSFDFPTTIYTMARGADGAVWVSFNAGMESCAAMIDPAAQKLGEYHTFTRGMDGAEPPFHYLLNAAVNPGESTYNFYYHDKTSALWAVKVEEDGSLTEERAVDLFNSGITSIGMDLFSLPAHELCYLAFLTDDLLLTMQNENVGWSERHDVLSFLSRTEDVDMSEQTVITIAYAYPLDTRIVSQITDFKKSRPNVSIVLEDYSVYATEEDSRAGESKLCFDLVNGFIKPDIVVTDASGNTVRDDMVMTQLYRKNLYVDLVPYLEKDDTINFDTLFGCVRNLFDDGKGGMWGISTDFDVGFFLGSTEHLGEYAEKGSWTLGEMLDYFDSLPEDTEKVYFSNLKQVNWRLLCNGYAYFIDDNTCSFDSEEFVRLLKYLKTLPADYKEWRKTSPVADIYSLAYSKQDEAIYDAIAAGKIALESYSAGYTSLHELFCTEEYFPIGYATKTDSGFCVGADDTYSITTLAEDPDLCFELLKTFFVFEEKITDSYGSFTWPMFSLKSHFEQGLIKRTTRGENSLTEEERKALYEKYGWPYTPMDPLPEAPDAEELAEIYALFDRIGSPIINGTPDAVADIVDEEISAYLSDFGTAEECAKKIQSRVEIWLAEHE